MIANPQPADDLLVSANFIRAVRESGYLSLSTALAELIDNSLQARATEIDIRVARRAAGEPPQIDVEDNGVGMGDEDLAACLRFGGSSRFDERLSFGRFGMGLPAASLSQSRRVSVTTWQGDRARTVALDVDAIASGDALSFCPQPAEAGVGAPPSGCRVTWRDCDRVEYRRLAWLERALRRDLGRMYRRFLANGLIIRLNDIPVESVDPTLLTTVLDGATASLAFDPLKYEIETATGETADVTVRFSTLPVQRWHGLDNLTKRRVGIIGQGGVSILRAGREIANGWYLMGGKRKENYDDWWRCEIEFEPRLDEHFGITINKQGIRPTRTLREALEPELEPIARLLNARVRQAFEDVKFQAAAATSCRIASAAEAALPAVGGEGRSRGPLSYRIESAPLPLEYMFQASLHQRTLEVTLNVDHPAFAALYRPLQGMEEGAAGDLRTALELMILSYVRATLQAGHDSTGMLRVWSDTYGRMLQRS